jgi:hypothetical protein
MTTGYGRPRPTSIRELTEVGAGTPMGEVSFDATAPPVPFEAGNFLIAEGHHAS